MLKVQTYLNFQINFLAIIIHSAGSFSVYTTCSEFTARTHQGKRFVSGVLQKRISLVPRSVDKKEVEYSSVYP